MRSADTWVRGAILVLGTALLAAVWLALPQLARNGQPPPADGAEPTALPTDDPLALPSTTYAAYPYPGLPEATPIPIPVEPPTSYPGQPTETLPPTSYPGQATAIPTLNADQLTRQAATWQPLEQTRIAAGTAFVLQLTATNTPMPPGRYLDPYGRYAMAWPAGWYAPSVSDPQAGPNFTNFPLDDMLPNGGFPAGGMVLSFGQTYLPPDYPFEAWVQLQRDTYAYASRDLTTFSPVYPTTVATYPALAFDSADGNLQIYLLMGDGAVMSIYLTPYTPDNLAAAQAILSTLVLTPPN